MTFAGGTAPVASAFEAVLRRFHRLVRSVGSRHGLDDRDMDEMMQDVRVRAWKAGAGETIREPASSYLYQTARSAAVDLIRRRRQAGGARAPLDAEHPDPRATPDRTALGNELAEIIFREVGSLMESRRVPVRMHLLGYEAAEIAVRLGWSRGKTRNLLSRGLADLRVRLEARGVGPEGLR